MDDVGVRELRQNLSVYLRRVKAGESLRVTEGRILPPSAGLDSLGLPLRLPLRMSTADALDERDVSEKASLYYLDASALLKLVVEEPESPALVASLPAWPHVVSSSPRPGRGAPGNAADAAERAGIRVLAPA